MKIKFLEAIFEIYSYEYIFAMNLLKTPNIYDFKLLVPFSMNFLKYHAIHHVS